MAELLTCVWAVLVSRDLQRLPQESWWSRWCSGEAERDTAAQTLIKLSKPGRADEAGTDPVSTQHKTCSETYLIIAAGNLTALTSCPQKQTRSTEAMLSYHSVALKQEQHSPWF